MTYCRGLCINIPNTTGLTFKRKDWYNIMKCTKCIYTIPKNNKLIRCPCCHIIYKRYPRSSKYKKEYNNKKDSLPK